MDILLNKLGKKVKGIITGFDRIVFKGMLRPMMYAAGMQYFLQSKDILNKDFKNYAMTTSKAIVQSAEEISKKECDGNVTYISSINERKETLAHERQKADGVNSGMVGVWSCVESCRTFRSTFNPNEKYPILKSEQSRCKHLYFYFDDPQYGFMSIRLQTWAPYEIQIALNGREWLKRSLDENNCGYVLSGNKFLHIDDYELAQNLLDSQFNADFEKILTGFLPSVFPLMPEITGGMSYYFTLWQSEVAKDYIFDDRSNLEPLMHNFLRHSLMTGTGERILHYFGSPVKAGGQPHPNSNPEILSRANIWYDGLRIRHWNGKNSVKFYNEHNVLRFEMTMNDPGKYKIHRHAENQDKAEPKKFMPIRKGIADISVRAEVSKSIINRFSDHMSTTEEKIPAEELIMPVSTPIKKKDKKVRSIDVIGKDLELLRAVSDPVFDVSPITNKELQAKLKDTPWAKNMQGKQLSGRISRHISLLREHGLIKKLPNQNKYSLTDKGRKITTFVNVALASSINDLIKLSA